MREINYHSAFSKNLKEFLLEGLVVLVLFGIPIIMIFHELYKELELYGG